MLLCKEVTEYALSLMETDEKPQFEIISYKRENNLFITHSSTENGACLRLNIIDPAVFCKCYRAAFYPVPNAWCMYGWTLVNLKKAKRSILKDTATCAFCNVPANFGLHYKL